MTIFLPRKILLRSWKIAVKSELLARPSVVSIHGNVFHGNAVNFPFLMTQIMEEFVDADLVIHQRISEHIVSCVST